MNTVMQVTHDPRPKTSENPTPQNDVCEVEFVDEERVHQAQGAMKSPELLARLSETFRVFGDPTRVAIAWALSGGELCVCDLARVVGRSQSAVSHSLRALRQLRLVTFRKVGRIAYYRLDDDHVASLLAEGFRHLEGLR
jgi:DNA-binding transcriptional ArsR family regulator